MSEVTLSSSSMPLDLMAESMQGGFDFENVIRNEQLMAMEKKSAKSGKDKSGVLPRPKKTGTTIAGVVFKDGVVLGADTRATNDVEIAEKNCEKIHYMAPNIYCCGAGTAADTEQITNLMASQLELLRMNTHSKSRLVTACTLLKRRLFRYQGYISAALILGGCDINGPSLYQIHPHGSTAKLNYTTMGSGSLAAMAVMESSWKHDLDETEAIALVTRAISAGIFNDLGSGSNCDLCIIRTDGSLDYRRNTVTPNPVAPLRNAIQHSERLLMKPGLTPIIGEATFIPHPSKTPAAAAAAPDAMEVES